MKQRQKMLTFFMLMLMMICCSLPQKTFSAATSSLEAASIQTRGKLTEGQKQKIFITETGTCSYYSFQTKADEAYMIQADCEAGPVSLVLTDTEGKVSDIISAAEETQISRKKMYITSTVKNPGAGTIQIGISSSKVAKVILSVKKLPVLTPGETYSEKTGKKQLSSAYAFRPDHDGIYSIFAADSRSDSTLLQICSSKGKVLRSKYLANYCRDYSMYIRRFTLSLKKGSLYYIQFLSRKGGSTREAAVIPQPDPAASVISLGDTGAAKLENYSQPGYFSFQPKKSALYFFSAQNSNIFPKALLFDANGKKLLTAKITRTSTDSNDHALYCREFAFRLEKGKTYYLMSWLPNYAKGRLTLKTRQLAKITGLHVVHKPLQKEYLKGVDARFDLTGTVLAIRHADGRSTKWVYENDDIYIEGHKLKLQKSKSPAERTAAFRYRGKEVLVKIPVITPGQKYENAPLLTETADKNIRLTKNKPCFYRFSPQEFAPFSIKAVKENYKYQSFYCRILTPKGRVLDSDAASSSYDSKTRRTTGTARAAAGLQAGRTYYLMVHSYEEDDLRLKLCLKNERPDAPKGCSLSQYSDTEAVLSFRKVAGAKGYRISYIDLKKPDKKYRISTTYNTENYIGDLKPGHSYRFWVKAYKQFSSDRFYGPSAPGLTLQMTQKSNTP